MKIAPISTKVTFLFWWVEKENRLPSREERSSAVRTGE